MQIEEIENLRQKANSKMVLYNEDEHKSRLDKKKADSLVVQDSII